MNHAIVQLCEIYVITWSFSDPGDLQESCDHASMWFVMRSRQFARIMWSCNRVICYVIQVICEIHVIMWSCDLSVSYAIRAICELWIAIKKMMYKMIVLFSIF